MTVRFLLVAPCNGEHTDVAERAASEAQEILQARSSSTPQLLVQSWVDLDPAAVEPADDVQIELAARCMIGERQYFAIEVRTAQRRGDDVIALETRLSAAARRYVTAATGIAAEDLPWVARYALLDGAEREPAHWMGAERHTVDVTEAAAVAGRGQVSIEAGWGNGLVRGWDALQRDMKYQLTRGIIDAQHIWHDASVVVSENETVFGRVIAAQHRPGRREVRTLLRDSSRIEIEASAHQLLLDDLIQNIQGVRRLAAESLLDAWGYERFVGRMLDRVRDAAVQVGNLRTRIDARYHAAVQTTLLALGFLVVVDTILSFISTAYSGAVDDAPGGDGGLFALLRSGDSDLLLVGALAVTLVLTVLFTRRR